MKRIAPALGPIASPFTSPRSMKQGMTAQQITTLNTKLNQLRALAVQVQISNILTAQHVADATRTVNRLKGLK